MLSKSEADKPICLQDAQPRFITNVICSLIWLNELCTLGWKPFCLIVFKKET